MNGHIKKIDSEGVGREIVAQISFLIKCGGKLQQILWSFADVTSVAVDKISGAPALPNNLRKCLIVLGKL